jgi:hypothetical protein
MKELITSLFLFSTLNFSQTFLDATYNNGDPLNSTNLSLIQKITFTSTDLSFLLTDNSTVSKALSTINLISFSSTDDGNPVPIELASFIATINGNEVILEWSTVTEVDNYGFEVERSLTPTPSQREGDFNWEKIGFVNGHGNSNSPKEYSFTDIPSGGTKLNYRLKQIDNDGKYEYSDAVSIEIDLPLQYSLRQNYPNPFNPTTIISYSISKDVLVELKVFDVLGREVASLVNKNQKAGSYEVIYDGRLQASGIYICKMSSDNYSSSIKMLLTK